MSPSTSDQPGSAGTPRCCKASALLAMIGALALIAAIVALYAPAIHAPFIADDVLSVVENETIHRILPPWTVDGQPGPLSRSRGNPVAARPLVNLTLALNYKFGQLDPTGYRAVNVALHALAALLLWALVARALRLAYFHGRFD